MRCVFPRPYLLHTVLVASLAIMGCQRSGTAPGERSAVTPGDPARNQLVVAPPAPRPYADDFPQVVLETSLGKLTLSLDAKIAPRTVHNFLHYVENGFYDQTIFHQVEEGYVIVGGGFTSDLTEKPARYPVPNEAAGGRKNLRATVAMARQPDTIDSSVCQFFVNLTDNPHLDHRGEAPEDYGYCVFGEVVEGLDVLDRIAQVEVRSNDEFPKLPVETVLIESAYLTR